MAEGLLRHHGGEKHEVYSAGTHPSFLNPRAAEAMRETGIDISAQHSKSIDEFSGKRMDVVITVCDNARQLCPDFPGAKKKLHWNIEDPYGAGGTDEEVRAVFRECRDEILRRIRHEIL